MFDIQFKEKDNQIQFVSRDGIIIKECPTKDINDSDGQLTIKIKFCLLKKYGLIINIKNFKKELLTLFLFIIVYLYYYLSLEACSKGEEICSVLFKWQTTKIYQELKSCFLFVFILEIAFYKMIAKLHLIHFVLVFFLFYIYSHGTTFNDHGYFNFIFFFIIATLIIILFIPFNILLYILRKKRKIFFLISYVLSLMVIFYFFLYSYIYIKKINCDDWGKGLNETSIRNNNSIYACQIQFPKICPYKLLHFFLDFTKITKKNCTKFRKNIIKNTISPFITKATKRFGYPLSNKDPTCIKEIKWNTLKKNFLKNLVDMDNTQVLDKYFKNKIPEVLVDYTDNIQGKIEINVHHDKILSKKRKSLEKNYEPLSNNILIIFIDSVSRQNAMRELKKTLEFFEKFIHYKGGLNEKYPNEKYHSFEFFKYHAFEGFTSINYPLLFYGQSRFIKKKNLINKYLKKNGFITSLAHDMCIRDNTKVHKFILDEVYDHELILCDPNMDNPSSSNIRCLYGKTDIEHLLNYTEQFWRKYSENRKYSLIVSNYGHEGTLQVVKYADNHISKFLWNLFDDNLLINSTIFLISDHGATMPSLYYINDFYKIEGNLPMLYIFVNDKKNLNYEQQYKYMHENQQNFITAFDFYNTLCNIIFGDYYKNIKNKTKTKDYCKSPYGESLFKKINNNKNRHPKYYNKITKMSLYTCK